MGEAKRRSSEKAQAAAREMMTRELYALGTAVERTLNRRPDRKMKFVMFVFDEKALAPGTTEQTAPLVATNAGTHELVVEMATRSKVYIDSLTPGESRSHERDSGKGSGEADQNAGWNLFRDA